MSLIKVAQSAAGTEVQYEPQRCLRQYTSNDCTSCFSTCPKSAIELQRSGIIFKSDICDNCGICLNTCRQQVFYKKSHTKLLIKKIHIEVNAIFVCSHSKQKNSIEVECLAELNEAVLVFGALKTGSSYLVSDACNECALSEKALPLMEQKVSSANNILACLEKTKASVELIDSAMFVDKHISRKDFFKSVASGAMNLSIDALLEQNNDNRVNEDRQILAGLLAKEKFRQNVVLESPFYSLNLKPECNYCLKCASICPTRAMYFVLEDKDLKLVFETNNCTGCNLCVEVCPSNCLSVTNKTNLSIIDKELVLGQAKARFCKCGELVATDKNLCPKCSKKESLSNRLQELF